MSNNNNNNGKEDPRTDSNPGIEGLANLCLAYINALSMNYPGNYFQTHTKHTIFRAESDARQNSAGKLRNSDRDNTHLTYLSLSDEEGDETMVEVVPAEEEEEVDESTTSSSLLRSPEVGVNPPHSPRVPDTPSKEDGASTFRTPEKFGTPASSSAVSVVRRDITKKLTMTGSVKEMREERRDAAAERRKEARDRKMGRDLLSSESTPIRPRLNSAPAQVNMADLANNILRDYSASSVKSGDPSEDGVGTDLNLNSGEVQRVADPAPGQPNPTGGQVLAAAGPLTDEGGNRSLPQPPMDRTETAPPGGAAAGNPKSKKKGRRSDRRSKNKKPKSTTRPETDQGAGPSGIQHPGDVFAMPDPVATLTITRPGVGTDGMALVAQTLFQIPINFNMTNPIRPVPDGAILDVCDQESVEAVADAFRSRNWNVVVTPIWPRYEFTAPALLAGSGPNDQGPSLDPLTIVRGLINRNAFFGLSQDSLRFVSSAWEEMRGTGEREGQTLQRLRIWVDVSPEGEEFLRGHAFLLRTLSSAVRLRPAPRSRQRPGGS